MSISRRLGVFAGLSAGLAMAAGAFAQGGNADPAAQKIFDKLIAAIKVGDRNAFLADASE
jgi:hypothetical protein